jgi:hypothetical protein
MLSTKCRCPKKASKCINSDDEGYDASMTVQTGSRIGKMIYEYRYRYE